MDPDITQKLEEFNYKRVNKGETSCIHCEHADSNLDVSNEGNIISYCYQFHMKVDELHICDLIS